MAEKILAKLRINSIVPYPDGEGGTKSERLTLNAFPKSEGYGTEGADPENTYAWFAPEAGLSIAIDNPDMVGTFAYGDVFIVEMTKVRQG